MKRELDNGSGIDPKRIRKKDALKAGSGFDTRWKFKVEPQPPKFPFLDEYFDLNVFLVDQDGKLKCGFEVPIGLDLFVEGESIPVSNTASGDSSCIVIHKSTPAIIDKTGKALIRVKVCELSMNRNNRKFCFVVKRKAGPRGDLPRDINPVMTRAMLVINAQITVTSDVPKIWYKDQGGRDKCIDIDVELIGPKGIINGQEVPLKAVLLYEDFQKVLNQEILQPSPTTHMMIGRSGKAQIRLRIEDVSKNHQSKNFRIKIEPDTSKSPIHYDKSPDMTGPILVRSKLNRRQKQRLLEQQNKELNGGMKGSKVEKKEPSSNTFTSNASFPNPEHSKQDLNKLPPQVATAVWCEQTRETLASFHLIATRLIVQYDSTIRPNVQKLLSKHENNEKRKGTKSLQSSPSLSSSSTISMPNLSSSNNPIRNDNNNNSEGLPSLLPQSIVQPDQQQQQQQQLQQPMLPSLDRGISLSSTGLANFMRSTTGLLRGLSGSLQGFDSGDGGPVDFRRDLSVLSVSGPDDSFGQPFPRLASAQGLATLNQDLSGFDPPNSILNKRQTSRGSVGVKYLLKQLYKVQNEVKGMPAFDASKRLVGFYFQHGENIHRITGFKSLEQSYLGPEHINQCENALRTMVDENSSLVLTLKSAQDGYAAADQYFQSIQK